MTDFDDFLDVLDDSPFEQLPVDVRTFVESPEYLGLPYLSDIQYDIVEAMSQVYYLDDIKRYMSRGKAEKHFKKFTKTEIILKLGKGSGKDHTSTAACAYVVYKLLCLKDPAAYYGKPPGDAIDILNVAVNAQQAKNVFFKGFKTKIKNSPWFAGKFDPKIDSIDFDKSISVYSGHSERESHEGLNLILAILDEISGFAMDNPSGLEKAKTGDAIYKAFRGTVDSRFDMGKVVLLSFPRYDGCFISKRYDEVVAEKEQVQKEHIFVIDKDKPHDDSDNQFVLRWKEDHIISYRFPGFYALCRPTWEVNPTKHIDNFLVSFLTDEMDARTRFLAQPSQISDALFGRIDKIEQSIVHMNPLGDLMRPLPNFMPKKGVKYFMHADLAQKVDRCAVGISHVEKWVGIEYSSGNRTTQPYVVCDAIGYWKPGVGKPVDLAEVKKWVIDVRSLGFDIELITFDRWGSVDMQRDLIALGFKAENLSVAKKHYEDLMVIMYEDRLRAPQCYNPNASDSGKELLFDELKNLRVVKDKVEHPRSASGKDLSDALCGSVFNAATRSVYNPDTLIEVHDITTHFEDRSWIKDKPIEISEYDESSEEEEVEYRLL